MTDIVITIYDEKKNQMCALCLAVQTKTDNRPATATLTKISVEYRAFHTAFNPELSSF